MHLLEVPTVFAGLGFDSDDRSREQVVAESNRAVVVGARVARGEIDEPELGVDSRRVPNGRAAVHPDLVVLRPGVVPDFAGPRDRVERPGKLAVARAERFHAAANAALATGEARVDESVEIKWGARDRVAFLPALGLHRPRDAARALVECHELAVELTDEHLAVAESDAAARPAAAHGGVCGVEIRAVLPQDRTAVDADGEHVVGARADVDHAVVDDRLRLTRVLRA